MTKTIDRTFNAFYFHAHIGKIAVPDYHDLFQQITDNLDRGGQFEVEGRLFSISDISLSGEFVFIIAHEGDIDVNPLLYNRVTREERVGEKGRNEVLSTRTHAVIDLNKKRAVVEYNQRGAKAGHIAGLLQKIGQGIPSYTDLTTTLVEIPGGEFLEKLEEFTLIKSAHVVLVRPNPNFHDAEMRLMAIAEESSAERVEVQFSAGRNGSIQKRGGIIGDLKRILRKGIGTLANVVIKGKMPGQSKDQTLKLKDFKLRKTVTVARDKTDGYPVSNSVQAEMLSFLKELPAKLPPPTQNDTNAEQVSEA